MSKEFRTKISLNLRSDPLNKRMAMMVATHETGFARGVADHGLFLDDGIIMEEGKPEEILYNPKECCTKEFLSKVYRQDRVEKVMALSNLKNSKFETHEWEA